MERDHSLRLRFRAYEGDVIATQWVLEKLAELLQASIISRLKQTGTRTRTGKIEASSWGFGRQKNLCWSVLKIYKNLRGQ